MHMITEWAQVINHPKDFAESVSSHWMSNNDQILEQVIREKDAWDHDLFFEAGHHSATLLKHLIGETATTATNHSISKDQNRESDFLTGYLCGLSGMCDLEDVIFDCMPDPVPYALRDSVDAMSEGMMHG